MVISKRIGELFNSVANRIGFLAAFLVAAGCSGVWASESVSLGWDQSTDTNVAGYMVHYGDASGAYTSSIDATDSTGAAVPGLQPGVSYYFVVASYNSAGLESVPSNEVAYEVPIVFPVTGPSLQMEMGNRPGDPALFRFLGSANQTYEIQATEDFQTWSTISHILPLAASQLVEYADTNSTGSGRRFYRLVAP
jgi:hypothetical protein